MNKAAIVMFNTTCCTKEMLEYENLYMIDLHVFFGEEEFFGNSLELLKYYDEIKVLPTTSQPSTQEIVDTFNEALKKHDEIIVVCPSENLSGTLNNTRIAIEMMDDNHKIHMVKARSFTLSEFGVFNQVKQMQQDNVDTLEIVAAANEYAKHFETYILPGSLEYMKHGGRVNMAQLVIGKLMTLKILVRHIEPTADVYKKLRGLKSVINQFGIEMDKGVDEAFYSSFDEKENDKVFHELSKLAQERGITLHHAGLPSPIVTCQFGANTFGYAHKLKQIPAEFEALGE